MTMTTRWPALFLAVTVLLAHGPAFPAEPDEPTEEKPDPARAQRRPTEFFSVFHFGYGADNMPQELERFETLVRRISAAGYNAILCKYTEERADVCKKHGIRMVVDLLVPQHHVYKSPGPCKALCQSLRDDPVVLAYHLWSDRFGDQAAGRIRDIRNVHKWDPTHPTYIGTYEDEGIAALAESDLIGYYDFHWKRNPQKNFVHLLAARNIAEQNDARIARLVSADPAHGRTGAGNIARHRYTLNTSIACGLKGCLWFIGERTMNTRTLEWTGLGLDVNHVLAEIMPMKHEIPKLGNAVAIYSTPITRTLKNRPTGSDVPIMPRGLEAHRFPDTFWIQPGTGEFVMGVFRYEGKLDAVFVASHNACAEQEVTLEIRRDERIRLFDRAKSEWRDLPVEDQTVTFTLDWGGGELLLFGDMPEPEAGGEEGDTENEEPREE